MRNACRVLFSLAVAALAAAPAHAASLEELVSAVVRIKTYINPDGQTVQSLGREREGSGVVIDEEGLVLTSATDGRGHAPNSPPMRAAPCGDDRGRDHENLRRAQRDRGSSSDARVRRAANAKGAMV